MKPELTEQPQRPLLLVVLCLLTFIGSGTAFLANGFLYITIDDWKQAYENGLFDNLKGLLQEDAMQLILNVHPGFFLVQSIIYFFSLVGAILMWNLRKSGFHIYAIAQVLLLISYNMFLPSAPFPLFPLLLSVTFILLYYRNISVMH